jgi:hypothetical protein
MPLAIPLAMPLTMPLALSPLHPAYTVVDAYYFVPYYRAYLTHMRRMEQ